MVIDITKIKYGDPIPPGYTWYLESLDYGNGPAHGNAMGYFLRPTRSNELYKPTLINPTPGPFRPIDKPGSPISSPYVPPKEPTQKYHGQFDPVMWHPHMHQNPIPPQQPLSPYMPPTKYPVGETRPGYLGGPEPPRPTTPFPKSGGDSLLWKNLTELGNATLPDGSTYKKMPGWNPVTGNPESPPTYWDPTKGNPPISVAPLNPEFIKYQEEIRNGTAQKQYFTDPATGVVHGLGLIPSPVQEPTASPGWKAYPNPITTNLVNQGTVTTIGKYGGKPKGKNMHKAGKKPKKQEKIFYGI
jgi:hypothetical protein